MMSKIEQFESMKVYFENVLPEEHFGDCPFFEAFLQGFEFQ